MWQDESGFDYEEVGGKGVKRLPIGTRVLVDSIFGPGKFDPPVLGRIIRDVEHGYTVYIPSYPRSLPNMDGDMAWYVSNNEIVSAFYPLYEEKE